MEKGGPGLPGPLWILELCRAPINVSKKNGVSLGLFHPEFQNPTYNCFLGPPYWGVAYIVYHHVIPTAIRYLFWRGHFSLWWNVWRVRSKTKSTPLKFSIWNPKNESLDQMSVPFSSSWCLAFHLMFSGGVAPANCFEKRSLSGRCRSKFITTNHPVAEKKTFKCWWKVKGIPPPKMLVKPTLPV